MSYRDCPICGREDVFDFDVRGKGTYFNPLEVEIAQQECGCVLSPEQKAKIEQQALDAVKES